jgi:UDP-N-acetylmuramyl tripeptide synthase
MLGADAPSRDLRVVGVTGSSGKTTVSWLVRGLLEEMQQLTGMVGNIEYALAEDRWGAGSCSAAAHARHAQYIIRSCQKMLYMHWHVRCTEDLSLRIAWP